MLIRQEPRRERKWVGDRATKEGDTEMKKRNKNGIYEEKNEDKVI